MEIYFPTNADYFLCFGLKVQHFKTIYPVLPVASSSGEAMIFRCMRSIRLQKVIEKMSQIPYWNLGRGQMLGCAAVSSIFSMKIPYPLVRAFTKTWVTVPTSLPFCMIGLPLTRDRHYGQHVMKQSHIHSLFFYHDNGNDK